MEREPRQTTWELWLADLLPLPYFATGALVAALLLGLQLAYHALAGHPIWDAVQGRPVAPVRTGLVIAPLVGYALATF